MTQALSKKQRRDLSLDFDHLFNAVWFQPKRQDDIEEEVESASNSPARKKPKLVHVIEDDDNKYSNLSKKLDSEFRDKAFDTITNGEKLYDDLVYELARKMNTRFDVQIADPYWYKSDIAQSGAAPKHLKDDTTMFFFPILYCDHWTLVVWHILSRRMDHYDPLGSARKDMDKEYLQAFLDNQDIEFNTANWPKQHDGKSCGYYVLAVIRFLLGNEDYEEKDLKDLKDFNLELEKTRFLEFVPNFSRAESSDSH